MDKKYIDRLKDLKAEMARIRKELEEEKNHYAKLDENYLFIKYKEADLTQRNSVLESENKRLNTENQQLREKIAESSKNANVTDVLVKMTYHF